MTWRRCSGRPPCRHSLSLSLALSLSLSRSIALAVAIAISLSFSLSLSLSLHPPLFLYRCRSCCRSLSIFDSITRAIALSLPLSLSLSLSLSVSLFLSILHGHPSGALAQPDQIRPRCKCTLVAILCKSSCSNCVFGETTCTKAELGIPLALLSMSYLTQCINQMVSESHPPHEIVIFLF